ncbi:MAG: hypothetical protein FWH23_04400 [Bacteroidales bacterium]|nr:hypothetical protein [Bacteroidales bacterium]MCL2133196.1 hypothetical protein [Bacteroidales bacterium]
MKKRIILLVGCLSLLIAGFIAVSCSKDSDGCTCTYTDEYGNKETETISKAELGEYGISTCNELQVLFELFMDEGGTITCK